LDLKWAKCTSPLQIRNNLKKRKKNGKQENAQEKV
jgi:hypothetical protein